MLRINQSVCRSSLGALPSGKIEWSRASTAIRNLAECQEMGAGARLYDDNQACCVRLGTGSWLCRQTDFGGAAPDAGVPTYTLPPMVIPGGPGTTLPSMPELPGAGISPTTVALIGGGVVLLLAVAMLMKK